ncbi:uncharacterized protein E0L32_006678 [Thyridium curvatum]|uniref:Uncharacterized protein n=1 Tax=Thyridium curvatum TaxID=1093900 RepID=A0A507B7Q1_9PEZI|nr:uncharacterized protein E0L32_006678 [Thyridium curvatum]TPX12798.1 hypothetical protein E0L32_006678 [Thyridium curvatum]
MAVLLVAALLHLPARKTWDTKNEASTFKMARLDIPGTAFLITFIIFLLLFLDTASQATASWTSLSWLLGSILSFACFISMEAGIATHTMTPLRILFGPEFLGAFLALDFGNVAWYGALFYIPLLYQAVGH